MIGARLLKRGLMPDRLIRSEYLDLHKFRVFAAVAEEEHFTRAATELAISQPAVSSHVHDLERALGAALFERAGRGARLTDAGRLVQGFARRLLAMAVELDEAIDDLRGLRAGQLRLGASTTIGDYLLPAVLGAFCGKFPSIGVVVEIGNTGFIADRLRHGELHLGLIGEAFADTELECEPFCDDRLVLVVAPGHRWAGREISPETLAEEPLIAREPRSATRHVTEAQLAAAGVPWTAGLQLGGTEAIKGAVAAGLGIAFLSACAVAQDVLTGRLAAATLAGVTMRRQFQVARRRGQQLNPAEAAFLPVLRAAVAVGQTPRALAHRVAPRGPRQQANRRA